MCVSPDVVQNALRSRALNQRTPPSTTASTNHKTSTRRSLPHRHVPADLLGDPQVPTFGFRGQTVGPAKTISETIPMQPLRSRIGPLDHVGCEISTNFNLPHLQRETQPLPLRSLQHCRKLHL